MFSVLSVVFFVYLAVSYPILSRLVLPYMVLLHDIVLVRTTDVKHLTPWAALTVRGLRLVPSFSASLKPSTWHCQHLLFPRVPLLSSFGFLNQNLQKKVGYGSFSLNPISQLQNVLHLGVRPLRFTPNTDCKAFRGFRVLGFGIYKICH